MNIPTDRSQKRSLLIEVRRALTALAWHYTELEERLDDPAFVVKLSRVVLRSEGNISITVSGNLNDRPKSPIIKDMVLRLATSIKSSFKTFAGTGLIGDPCKITEAPNEAELDRCFRIMLPFYPSPEAMPLPVCMVTMQARATIQNRGWGSSVSKAQDAATQVLLDKGRHLWNTKLVDVDSGSIHTTETRTLVYEHPSTFLL